jgi:asparagine synthase (glutamine-hydrolysing)
MYAGLEARTPFLDPALVSFVLQLPENQQYKLLRGKRLLRRVMNGRIPAQILNRKKQGFALPIGTWLRGPLRPLLEEALSPSRITAAGIVQPAAITTLIQEHLSGKNDHRKKLWTLMILHWWWGKYAN